MTDIRMTDDRIIFNGHADTKQECETITLMCDNLAKSKDFKTIRYESGYAEFEKVGKTEELKFPPYSQNVNFIFDSTISSILLTAGPTNTDNNLPATITESGGSSVRFGSAISGEPTTTTTICTLTIADGYELDTINATVSEGSLGAASNFITSNKTSTGFTFLSSAEDTTWYTVTLTTKAIVQKQTIDVSTLAGWANLATGNHQITIKTKASGYADSAASNAVTVSKAAVVSAGKLYFSGDAEMGNTPTATVNGVAVSNGYQLSFGDVIVINSKNGDYNGMKINGENITNLVNDYPPFNIDWTEGGDIVSTQEGFGPSNQNITINYLSPVGYSVSVATYEGNGKQSYEYSTDNGTTWNSITGEGQIVASTKQIKFRVTCNSSGGTVTDASIKSVLLNMDVGFSFPGQSIGTWSYSENYILTQNIDDIVCLPHL